MAVGSAPSVEHEALNQEFAARFVEDANFSQAIVNLVATSGSAKKPPVAFSEVRIMPGLEVPTQIHQRDEKKAAQ